MRGSKESNKVNSFWFPLFLLHLLMASPVLTLLQAEQVRELDRKDNWVLAVRDVPIIIPSDYKLTPIEAESAFQTNYQVLTLKTPEGRMYEFPVTNQGLFPEDSKEATTFFPFKKARFDKDWNKDGIPEIILTVFTPGYSLKSGRARPTEGNDPDYIVSFQEGRFNLCGVLGSSSGFSDDEYPAILPKPQEKWPEIFRWSCRRSSDEVSSGSSEDPALNPKTAQWHLSRSAFNTIKNCYESSGTWNRIGFTSVGDLNTYSTDLLSDKGEYAGPPTVYLRDDKVFLRDQNNQQAKKLGLLREGTIFYLLEMHGPSVEVGDALGPWFKVLVQSGPLKGMVGWVYGAYITPWKKQKIPALPSELVRELDRKDNWVLSVRDVPIALPSDGEIAENEKFGWSVMPSFQILILKSPEGETHELWLTDKAFFKRGNEKDALFYPLKKACFIEDRNKDGIPEVKMTIVVGGYYLYNGVSVPTSHLDADYWVSFQKGNSLQPNSFKVFDMSGKEALFDTNNQNH